MSVEVPGDSDRGWELLYPVQIDKNNKINLIGALDCLVHDDPVEDWCVAWSYDTLQDVIIVSNGELGGDQYSSRGKSSHYRANGKITPPVKLREAVEGEANPGDILYYLADREMLESDVSSAFLLTTEQVSREIDSIEPVR
jgi:hypothetical protein